MRILLIRIAAGLAALLALILVIGVAVGLWLATPSGRDFVLAQAQKSVPGLVIQGAEGSIYDLGLESVTLADGDGIWLTVTQAHVAWRPWALFTRTLRVADISAASIDLARQPRPDPDADNTPSAPPSLPLAARIDRIKADRILLGAELLGGSPALITLSGRASLPSGALGGAGVLDIARIDDKPGTLTLAADFRPGQRLTVNAEVTEQGNGLLAELLEIPGRPAVSITLQGDGPLTDWTGKMVARAGDVVDGSAELRIRPVDERLSFGLDLKGNIQALLPPDIRALVGPDLTIGAGGTIHPGKSLTLDGVGIQMALGRLSGGGQIDLVTRAVNLGAYIEVPDASPLRSLIAPAAFSAGRGSVTVTGTIEAPDIATDLTLDNPTAPDLAAGTLGIKVKTQALDGLERVGVTADITLSGVKGSLAAATGPAATLTLGSIVTRETGRIEIADLALTAASFGMTAKGTITNWGDGADLAAQVAAKDLAPMSGLVQRRLTGAFTGDIILRRAAGQNQVMIKASGGDLGIGMPVADSLLAGRTDLAADLNLGKDIRVNSLSLTNPQVTLSGNGMVGPGGIAADSVVEIADLSPLSAALGVSLRGSAKALLRGTGKDGLVLAVTTDGLRVDGLGLDGLVLDGMIAGLPDAARGRVALATTLNGQKISAGTDLSMNGQTLSLTGLSAVVGLNRFDGGVTLDTGTGLATGGIKGTVPDLGILAFIAGDEVWGNGSLSLDLKAKAGRQNADLQVDFKEIWRRWHGQKLATASLSATLAGGAVDADAKLTGLDAGTLDLDLITASMKGPLTAADIGFDLSGKRGSLPVRLSLAGRLGLNADDGITRLDLARLSGTHADTDFNLAGPARLSFGDGVMTVAGFSLRAGDASINLSADLGPKGLSGDVNLSKVPLIWARLIDPTLVVYGLVDAKGSLSGGIADPRGALDLTLTGVALTPPVAADAKPGTTRRGPSALGATMKADWQRGRLALTGAIASEGTGVGLKLAADLPLVLQGSATSFAMPDDQPVRGSLTGNLALRRLNDLLASSGDRLAGQMLVDLALSGSMGDPGLTGTVRLDKARYENHRWGTQITDIDALLTADADALTINRFEGKTADGGTLSVAGSIGLTAARGDKQVDLRVTTKRAKLAGIDMVEATASADITILGRLHDVTIGGTLHIDEAHIQIPDKLPPNVVELTVVEINHPRRLGSGPSATDQVKDGTAPKVLVIRFNLDIDAPNQIYIGGRGLDAELKAKLALRGTAQTPLVTGSVDLVKGEMGLLGQTFTLNKANMRFTGDGSLEPDLDVEARTQRGDLTAIITFTGRPSKPTVKLSSQPPYPEDEVLARLLFNRGAGQLSALEALQLAQSAAQLSGLFGGGPGFVDGIKRSLGVDRLEFRGSEDGQGAGTVAAGRYIGDDIYVGVEQELGTGQSKATVEYAITDHIKARGEVGTESKVGVQFEWDY